MVAAIIKLLIDFQCQGYIEYLILLKHTFGPQQKESMIDGAGLVYSTTSRCMVTKPQRYSGTTPDATSKMTA
jgi:hypothetical protein